MSVVIRRVQRLAAAAAVLSCCFACKGNVTTAPSPKVLFFEDFTEPALDRSRWTVRVTGTTVNDEQQAYVDDSTTLNVLPTLATNGETKGALAIRARSRPGYLTREGKKFDFVSGRMDTRGKFEFTFGTAEARMRLPSGAGLWPAFWILGAGPWPSTGEIDVMENVGDSAWVSAAMHGPGYSGDTPLVRRSPFPAGEDASGWHTYAVDWSADEVSFRVDEREVYRVTRAMVETYGRWAFNNKKFLILNLAVGGGYPRAVNRAVKPYIGLPEATVNRIRADSAVVLVDWVRVTQ